MNVDDATRERLQHWFVQNAHETRESDKFNTDIAQHSHELLFYLQLQAGAKSTRRQIGVRNTKLSRNIKNRCIDHIRNHQACFRGEIARPDALENRPAVASFPRPENSDWQPFHLSRLV